MDCRAISAVVGCLSVAGIPDRSVVIHYEYRLAADGETVLYKTRYTETDGVTVITLGANDTVTPGACGVTDVETIAPRSLDVTGTAVTTIPDALVRSVTVTREAGDVRFSTDSGATWVTMNLNGSRTWGSPDGSTRVNTANMRFEGLTATSNYDLVWEV